MYECYLAYMSLFGVLYAMLCLRGALGVWKTWHRRIRFWEFFLGCMYHMPCLVKFCSSVWVVTQEWEAIWRWQVALSSLLWYYALDLNSLRSLSYSLYTGFIDVSTWRSNASRIEWEKVCGDSNCGNVTR